MDIQKVIKRKGFTIKEVAEKMSNTREGGKGVSQGSLSTILNGNPSINKLKDVANIIGVSVSELVADDNSFSAIIDYKGELRKVTNVEELEKIVEELKGE